MGDKPLVRTSETDKSRSRRGSGFRPGGEWPTAFLKAVWHTAFTPASCWWPTCTQPGGSVFRLLHESISGGLSAVCRSIWPRQTGIRITSGLSRPTSKHASGSSEAMSSHQGEDAEEGGSAMTVSGGSDVTVVGKQGLTWTRLPSGVCHGNKRRKTMVMTCSCDADQVSWDLLNNSANPVHQACGNELNQKV